MKSTCDTAARASSGQSLTKPSSGAFAFYARSRNTLKVGGRLCRAVLLTLAASAIVPGTVALAEGDSAAGGEKSYTCLGCHGIKHYINTYPTYHVPRIAGQNREYLVAALHAYRDQTRSHPTMQANASLLTDQDIEDIAAWFSAQGAE